MTRLAVALMRLIPTPILEAIDCALCRFANDTAGEDET